MRGLIFVFSVQCSVFSVASAQQAATATAGGARASATLAAPFAPEGEPRCSTPTVGAMPAMERGFSRAVTRVGSPLAALRRRFAQRALARAQARAVAAEAAASRVHVFSVVHGPAAAGVALQETAEPNCAMDPLPTPVKE